MNEIDQKITEFGRNIFEAIGQEQPSTFDKNYWSGKMMEWSMSKPELKTNMFRLVDVLPSLKSSRSSIAHLNEYLGKFGNELGALADWGLNIDPDSIMAKPAAFAVKKAVEQMASQFIAGETPQEALKKLKSLRKQKIAFTTDLLGEFSVSEKEALIYLDRYLEALDIFGKEVPTWKESEPIIAGHPGENSPVNISIKLSAFYSQCSVLNRKRSVSVMSERLAKVVSKAKQLKANVYIDAEDSGNNIIVYDVFKQVFSSTEFKDFAYPGIVVQAYSKVAESYIQQLLEFTKKRGTPIAVRLVKGAYWDWETIICHQYDWECPLWKNKQSSDANFEKLSRLLIDNHQLTLPAIASHNIRSLSHACVYAESKGLQRKDYELQMLFGMADPIARAFSGKGYLVRQYVPLGQMLPGMGYLVRRLLENTSNESFLRHTFFEKDQVDRLLQPPVMSD